MKWTNRLLFTSILFVVLLVLIAMQAISVKAQENTGGRTKTILVSYTAYEWWLLSWSSNEILCKVIADHEGIPSIEEVIRDCGEELANYWQTSPPCKQKIEDGKTLNVCKGAYMYLATIYPAEKEIEVDLPEATVWVDLEGCEPLPPSNFCPKIPNLLLIGEEPLPNEEIISINGTYDGQPFTCPGSSCAIPLQPTSMLGSTIEFWADSSYGDSSEHYTAMVRVVDSGVSTAPGGSGWYVDVISTQWVGEPLGGCSRIWQSFPPVGEPPDWLKTPSSEELIATEAPYQYLAGRLISAGLIDVSECISGGLLPNGYADVCGLEKANPLLTEWQNQFDNSIIEVAKETNIPAQLLKNLFAEESQFWPGVFRVPLEFGLGQITDNGADSVLLWNETFYNQFCPLVLAQETCDKGYLGLSDYEQKMLRGATALLAKSDCDDCPTGIDLTRTHFSVKLFANTLLANCAQVCQTVINATGVENAGSVSTYEDLWRFTIANYHAGAGCLAYAVHQAWMNSGLLNWEQVKGYFTETCRGVVPYVEKITENIN